MKNLVLVPAVLGLAVALSACSSSDEQATATGTTSAAPSAADAELTGVWQMTSLETAGQEVPYSGQVAFTTESMSVQASNPDTAAPDTAYTVQGYEAYYGALTVDDEAGTFSLEVESALARDLVGQTLTRNFEVTDDTLVLTPTDPSEGWRVTYERESR